jgi:hypothetical protein
MTLRIACLACALLLLQSTWLIGQEANPNSRLRRSGQLTNEPSRSFNPPQQRPPSGNRVSVIASSSASAFGYGQGNGYGQNYGQGYSAPGQFNRGMAYGNGMGAANARAQASVTVNGEEPKSAAPSNIRSTARSQAANKASSSGKKNRTASYVDGDRMISVTESKNKIKVTITNEATDEEKSYSAKNVAELEKKFPAAYEAYKLAADSKDEDEANDEQEENDSAQNAADALMDDQLKKMEAENAGNPAMLQMLQQMRRQMGR